MGSMSPQAWLALLIWIVALGFPVARILGRMGFSRWLAILAVLPVVNLVFLWVVAFARWPRQTDAGA